MANTRVVVDKSYADSAALAAWVTNLAADITSNKVTGFQVYVDTANLKIKGELILPAPTGLTVAFEDEV